jgi:hypothetical protein
MDLSPSRTGLLAQTLWRSPGSRAHCLLTCLDSSTTPSPAATRDLTRRADVAFPLTEKGRHSVACFRSSMIPPASPLSTLRCDSSRNHRQDSRPEWSRFSFSVGLSHPLQCAGLSRRSLSRISLQRRGKQKRLIVATRSKTFVHQTILRAFPLAAIHFGAISTSISDTLSVRPASPAPPSRISPHLPHLRPASPRISCPASETQGSMRMLIHSHRVLTPSLCTRHYDRAMDLIRLWRKHQ